MIAVERHSELIGQVVRFGLTGVLMTLLVAGGYWIVADVVGVLRHRRLRRQGSAPEEAVVVVDQQPVLAKADHAVQPGRAPERRAEHVADLEVN